MSVHRSVAPSVHSSLYMFKLSQEQNYALLKKEKCVAVTSLWSAKQVTLILPQKLKGRMASLIFWKVSSMNIKVIPIKEEGSHIGCQKSRLVETIYLFIVLHLF